MEFSELESLQRVIRTLKEYHIPSLSHYHLKDKFGFRHIYGSPPKDGGFSKASTATCILSLTAAGYWSDSQPYWYNQSAELIKHLLKQKWKSADLEENNPFTVAFIFEAVLELEKATKGSILLDAEVSKRKEEAVQILQNSLIGNDKNGTKGAANLAGYPPSTYLTQLVVRVLLKCGELTDKTCDAVRKWSWQQLEHELALIFSNSKSADAYSLAYAVILFVSCSESFETTPDENHILQKAIECIFSAQLPDGSWPRSRPLFHYPRVGNAYCFEYEMLTQFLQKKELLEYSLKYIPQLSLATIRLRQTAFQFEEGYGWASGHHPQLAGPESWSTASVYHFLHELDRVLAEAIRRSVFNYVGLEFSPPIINRENPTEFCSRFWDSDLIIQGKAESLKNTLFQYLASPVRKYASEVESGRELPKLVPVSAVFFGPPGTSKTQLAKEIANYVGWPLLTIDPSHLVRKGLDQVQAETNTLFSMLASLEQTIVLLDEFDEMLRERTATQTEALSRFLTTAMLPKLTLINDRRRIIFIVATNHIEQFDFAVRRPGRFDLILQIMPPSVEAKLKAKPEVKSKLESEFRIDLSDITSKLEPLTFAEFSNLAKSLQHARNSDHAEHLIDDAYKRCTLMQPIRGEGTWLQECENQVKYIRVPGE